MFALIGDHPDVLPLVRAIADSEDHRLIASWRTDGIRDAVANCCSQITELESAAALSTDPQFDAVIVAGESPDVIGAARDAAEAGKSLLVWPLIEQDLGAIYELSLVKTDTPITLFPIFPLRVHPLVIKLRQMLDEGKLGVVQYLELKRALPPQAVTSESQLLTRAELDAAFLADVDMLRDLGGDYSLVTSLRTGSEEAISSVTTTLDCPQAPQATWTAKVGSEPSWELTIAGMRTTAKLTGNPADGTLTLAVDGPELTLEDETQHDDWGAAVLDSFTAAKAGDKSQPDWDDMQRGFEIMHATHRSLRRKRTIELFFEAHSERSTFKTQMTAAGCCVIMFTLFALVVVLLSGQLGLPPLVMKIMRIAMFVPLGLFLVLQFLLPLAKPLKERADA